MLNVKLIGHEFRYEVFQIVSLFCNKSEINFANSEALGDVESGFDYSNSTVYCRIYRPSEEPIFYCQKINSNDKKQFKNAIKMTVLKSLKEYTGIDIPWGILVGIRPTKIIHEGFKNGFSHDEMLMKLIEEYDVSREKAELTVEVALNESKFLSSKDKDISLYLGIPFCPTRCSYCSFTSNPINAKGNLAAEYLEALIHETVEMLKFIKINGYNINTVYIGGGTPTALSHMQLDRIVNTLGKHINLRELREFTIEAGRADSIDYDKLRVIKNSGCTRISINPQTMNDETLIRIGRTHTSKEVIDKYYMARELGFDNINMDMIIGLPGEGEKEIYNTVGVLERLSPENITVHTMAIKRASVLNEIDYGKRSFVAKGMYDAATKEIRNMGMYPYYMYRQKNMVSPLENVGYCKSGKEGIYNIQMIAENISIVALGADAVTKVVFKDENRIERAANLKDVREYNARVDEMIENKKRLFEAK